MTDSAAVPQTGAPAAQPSVDILMTVYNGMPYLPEQIASFQQQSWPHWRLHVRDDGSDDGTLESLRRFAAADPRIRLVTSQGEPQRLGAAGGFAWLVDTAAPEAEYVMFSDADDCWLPNKIELTLGAMLEAEAAAGGRSTPVLVHTDLLVVDRDLRTMAPSLWRYQGVDPMRASLNRLLVQNCVTGCTVMINRALRARAAPIPPEAIMHDWWMALVAASFGKVVPIPEGTILYRQHGRNDTGAARYPDGLRRWLAAAWRSFTDTAPIRDSLGRTTLQAQALLDRFGDTLPPETQRLVAAYAELPTCNPLRRRLRLMALGTLPQGLDRNLGYLLRV